MIPVLFKKNEQQFRTYGLGEITDIINPKVTRERNGQYLLYFQYPQNAELSDVFEEDMRIKSDAGVRTKWQTFEISRVIRKEGQLIEVFAKHISQSLLKDALNPSVIVRTSTAQQALNIWNNNRIGDENFDVWSDISTISSTSWNIRDVSNAFEALAGVQGSILDVWGGEYEFDNKLIRLHKEMGRKSPVPLEYGRNITGLEQDQQEDNVYTSVYPFATYIPESGSEPETVTLPERYVDGKYLEMHNKRKIQVVDFSGEYDIDNPPTVSSLRTIANHYLEANEVGLPHENLKVEYVDLSKTLDYQEFQTMEEVELNDRLPIFYPKFGIINENAKVVVINYDPVKEENISIELGVVGQSFRTVTTGGLGSRLDRVEKQQDATNNYIVNAKGNRIWFETPDENMEHKIGDTWFEKNGPYDRIRVWNGNQWETIIDSEDIDKNVKAIAEQQKEIEGVQQTADEVAEQINTAVSNAGFTSLDETISSVQLISNQAQINSGTAIDNALEAMQQASLAVDNTGSLNVRVDEVENTLSVKADKQTVDDLTGVVDTQALDIQANAQGLALKANQDTVDTLVGTVQSLGTEFDIVAGQVSSRVWNTDIETAIDGIEVGGRNYLEHENGRIKSIIAGGSTSPEIELVSMKTPFGEEAWKVTIPAGNDTGFAGNRVWSNHFNINLEADGTKYSYYTYIYIPKDEELDANDIHVYPTGRFGMTSLSYDSSRNIDNWKFYVKENYSSNRGYSGRNYLAYYATKSFNKPTTFYISVGKLEKGTKATDWTPAPEDTDAKFDYIETEWTQTFDSFSQTVSSIDGRVTAQKQTLDSISSTVSGHGSRISTVEQTASGLQSTVASKASQTQVTQLANLVDTKVTSSQVNSLIQSDKTIKDTRNTNESPEWYYDNYSKETVREFKRNSTLDISGEGTYGILETIIPWSDSSGGGIKQTLTTDHSVWERSGTGITWGKWKKTADVDWVGAQISVLEDNINLRVSKGELLSQINIEAGRTLIQSDKLLLNANNTVITGTAWMDGAVIANASIDTAQIADLAVSSAKIASLDVNKISGNTTQFVQSTWNNITTSVQIDNYGINVYGQQSWRRNYMNETGFEFFGSGAQTSGYKAGAIGRFLGSGTPLSRMNVMHNSLGRFSLGIGVNSDYDLTLGTSQGSSDRFNPSINIRGETGRIEVYKPLMVESNSGQGIRLIEETRRTYYGTSIVHVAHTFSRIHLASNRVFVESPGGISFYTDQGTLSFVANYQGLHMQNRKILNVQDVEYSSDANLKENITSRNEDDLTTIMSIEYKNYDFISGGKNKRGFIAQELQLIDSDLITVSENGTLGYDGQGYVHTIGHAVQQLALREENTNQIASQALQLGESNKEKIKRLEKRIEELESAA